MSLGPCWSSTLAAPLPSKYGYVSDIPVTAKQIAEANSNGNQGYRF